MIEAQRLLAANPETAPEILRELSQSDDRATRQAVAGNPNVPIDILYKLHREFPHEILQNPAFVNLTVADQVSLASNPETEPGVLRELSYHSDPEISGTVAQNPNIPIDVLLALLKYYPHAIEINPVLPIILMEDPYWLHHALEYFGGFDESVDPPELFQKMLEEDCPCTICSSVDFEIRAATFLLENTAHTMG